MSGPFDAARILADALGQELARHGRVSLRAINRVPAKTAWIAVGFVAGIAVWHTVGFWSFMSRVVFESPETTIITSSAPSVSSDPMPYSNIETGSLQRIERLTDRKAPEENCIALHKSHGRVETRSAPCHRLTRPLKHRAGSSKGDLQAARDRSQSASQDWTAVLAPLSEAQLELP